MPTIRSAVALLFLCGFAASPASATDYYVSSGGNDANAGTSAASPWLTLAPVNALALVPGDRVLLRAGDTFFGGLSFDAEDAGSPAAPIVITSYGAGRAAIYAGGGDGISVYNAAGYEISNLDLTGAGAWASGIVFYNDLPGGVKLGYIRIDGVDVSGFGRDGIEIGASNGSSGFRDVRITNASAHGNARTGIVFYAEQPNTHESAYVGFSRAFDNTGVIGAPINTGSGIVFGGVNGGTIERSIAHGNGRLCTAPAGPVGIWTYDSTAVVIQHNESYGNLTGGPTDGDGFDLDQNVSSSVLQYNYSHDNAGAGYLLAQGPLNDNHRGNTVRYNISQNDGRANSYAAIEIWGRIVAAEVYGNTVYLSPAASGTPRAVRIGNASIGDRFVAGLHLRNNILETREGLPIVEVTTGELAGAGDLLFQGNDYWSAGATWSVLWGGTAYSSLAAWRATAQETAAGAATGFAVDPLLNAAGDGGTLDDAAKLETLGAYKLQSSSSLIDRGLNLAASFGVNMGTIDFFGATLPQAAGYDVGANEATGPVVTGGGSDEIVLYAFTATAIAGTWTRIPDATAAGGARIGNPDAGAAKLTGALANPANYFELTFDAEAGRPYRLWVRGRADGDYWGNDSVFVQFSGSVDAAGSPVWRIGSTSSTVVNLEDCSGCGVSAWGWQDNGYGAGVPGPVVYFAASGRQTIRIQTREDGFSIDQIVISPSRYLTTSPGALTNDQTIVKYRRPW